MIGVDTNVLLRYLMQDDLTQSPIATRFFEKDLTPQSKGFISLAVIIETVWVLTSYLDASKSEISALLSQLLVDSKLDIQEHGSLTQAIQLYLAFSCDFADALIICLNRNYGCDVTVSFDKKAIHRLGMQQLS